MILGGAFWLVDSSGGLKDAVNAAVAVVAAEVAAAGRGGCLFEL